MNFFYRRRLRKHATHLVREIRHALNMREDIAPEADVARLRALEQSVRQARKDLDPKGLEKAAETLYGLLARLFPPRRFGWFQENFEIIAVAVIVALAFRAYFVQPFKIPTSSMSPTLHGVHYLPQSAPGWFDRLPLNLARVALFGEWYVEARSPGSGPVQSCPRIENGRFVAPGDVRVGGASCPVHADMVVHFRPGDYVVGGQLLASGLRVIGDHIFVNKVAWNYRQPQRGEIMVFKTHGIVHPTIKPNEHYVKRMVGLPGETLAIRPPDLLINGARVEAPPSIVRIETAAPGYHGYLLTDRPDTVLRTARNSVALGPEEYFACGDNQANSADSRYWGPVPRRNLVGPAFFVYWPLSRHWGPDR